MPLQQDVGRRKDGRSKGAESGSCERHNLDSSAYFALVNTMADKLAAGIETVLGDDSGAGGLRITDLLAYGALKLPSTVTPA